MELSDGTGLVCLKVLQVETTDRIILTPDVLRYKVNLITDNNMHYRYMRSITVFTFTPPGGIVITRVCLFVGWLVDSFVTLVDFSKPASPIFGKFGTDVQTPNINVNV